MTRLPMTIAREKWQNFGARLLIIIITDVTYVYTSIHLVRIFRTRLRNALYKHWQVIQKSRWQNTKKG